MQKPNISTAIPKRRYKFGVYTIVVLEEIQSKDEMEYIYLLAGIKDGHNKPEIYITCEKSEPASSVKGAYTIRVFAKQLAPEDSGQIIDQSDAWSDREAFINYGLSGFQQMLGLDDEEAYLLT